MQSSPESASPPGSSHFPLVRQGAQTHLVKITAAVGGLVRTATEIISSEKEPPGTKAAIPKNVIFTVAEAFANSMIIGAATTRLFSSASLNGLQDALTNPLFILAVVLSFPVLCHQLYHFRLKGLIREQKENPDWSISENSTLYSFLLCLKKLYRHPKYLFTTETFLSPFFCSFPILYRTITYWHENLPVAYSLGCILAVLISTKNFLAEQCSTVEETPVHLPKYVKIAFTWVLKLNLYSFFLSALAAYEIYKFSFIFTALSGALTGSSTTPFNVIANLFWVTLAPFIFVLTRDMLHFFDEGKMNTFFEKFQPETTPNNIPSFIADIYTILAAPIRFITQKYRVKDTILKIGYLFYVGLSFEVFTHPQQLSQIATLFSSSVATDSFQNPRTHLGILCGVMFIGAAILSGTLRCKLSAIPEYLHFQSEYVDAKARVSAKIWTTAKNTLPVCARGLSTMGTFAKRTLPTPPAAPNTPTLFTELTDPLAYPNHL